MDQATEHYTLIGSQLGKKRGVEFAKMMGHPTLRVSGKLFCCLFHDDLVFKLSGEEHAFALQLKGSKLFDPGNMGRPMKAWVQVPYTHAKLWPRLAEEACIYTMAEAGNAKPKAAKKTVPKKATAKKTVAKSMTKKK